MKYRVNYVTSINDVKQRDFNTVLVYETNNLKKALKQAKSYKTLTEIWKDNELLLLVGLVYKVGNKIVCDHQEARNLCYLGIGKSITTLKANEI